MNNSTAHLKALCVARHEYIAEHFTRYFATLGIQTKAAVGLGQAPSESRGFEPDVVICEYDLLATLSLDALERDELLSRCPIIAVSLTRRPQEAHLLDVNGIGGFLYLPLLDPAAAKRFIVAAAESSHARYVPTERVTMPLSSLRS